METVPCGPLSGVRVVELAGIGPTPFACMILAELGADVLRIDRPGATAPDRRADWQLLHRSRPAIAMDLKHPAAAATVLRFVESATVFVEGGRPGVAERLGLGPDQCLQRNPGLVYGRMTGWGQDGPMAGMAGHDINYLAVAGALHAIGTADSPIPPLNLVSDFGGGAMFLLVGILAALHERGKSGLGQVVDAAMVDGTASMMTMMYGLLADGQWVDKRASNILDGGAPFYRTYRCADGRHVAVGAIEPQFYAILLRGLGLEEFSCEQHDAGRWPAHHAAFESRFATRSRDEWAELFDGTDGCVTPVLSMLEAAEHPHLAARSTFTASDGVLQPAPAPRLSRTPPTLRRNQARPGEDLESVLKPWGFNKGEIDSLIDGALLFET